MTPWQIAGTATGVITTIGALLGTFFLIDDRYAHHDDVQNAKNEIITEMRHEVVKNRSVMIEGLVREADDLEFEMAQREARGDPVPRYMIEKHKGILRLVKELSKDED
jgi:Mg2+ and Co2+ transporter CorA